VPPTLLAIADEVIGILTNPTARFCAQVVMHRGGASAKLTRINSHCSPRIRRHSMNQRLQVAVNCREATLESKINMPHSRDDRTNTTARLMTNLPADVGRDAWQ
jgi:hypothetical protein